MLSDAELAALGIDAEAPAVRISGFADMGFGASLVSHDSQWRAIGASPPRCSSIDQVSAGANGYLLDE